MSHWIIIGFVIFIPFLVIDLIVSSSLMSMVWSFPSGASPSARQIAEYPVKVPISRMLKGRIILLTEESRRPCR